MSVVVVGSEVLTLSPSKECDVPRQARPVDGRLDAARLEGDE